MNNLAENIMDFKKDFENFKQYILLNKSDDEIRYEKVIKECKNPEIVKAAKVQLKWIRPFYNLQNRNLVDEVMKEIIENRKIKNS